MARETQLAGCNVRRVNGGARWCRGHGLGSPSATKELDKQGSTLCGRCRSDVGAGGLDVGGGKGKAI